MKQRLGHHRQRARGVWRAAAPMAIGNLDFSRAGLHASIAVGRGARFGFALLFPAGILGDYRGRIRRRLGREHRGWRADRAALRAISLGAPHCLSLTLLLQTVPIVAIAPLHSDVGRRGNTFCRVIAFIISLAPIIANTTQGLISVDENLVHLFLMHNASPAQVLFKLRLPHAVPSLFVGIRIASGIAVIGAITGELYAGSSRVGGAAWVTRFCTRRPSSKPIICSRWCWPATVLGFAFFFLVMFFEWYFLHKWHESAARPRKPEGRQRSS